MSCRRQGGKKSWEGHDAAEGKLFAGVSKRVWNKPSFHQLYQLMDNYVAETGVKEEESAEVGGSQVLALDACRMF
eukprot:334998-Chlamydomonas_euryale.AAC.7